MSRARTAALAVVGLVVAGIVAYTVVLKLNREASAVDDGVVEFKKGNYGAAVRLLAPYADRGNKTAELNLAICYAFGLGVQTNRERAHALLRGATGVNAPEMYLWIAKSLENGEGVAKNPEESVAWYRIAAAEGSTEAKDYLKRRGESGQPVGGGVPAGS
jgi:TPR repeat protein